MRLNWIHNESSENHIGGYHWQRAYTYRPNWCKQRYPARRLVLRSTFYNLFNPIAWYIRSTEGYSISKDKNTKVKHNLFVNDLKTYHKSQSKATLITNTVKRNVKKYWTCAHNERKNDAKFRASSYKRRQRPGPGTRWLLQIPWKVWKLCTIWEKSFRIGKRRICPTAPYHLVITFDSSSQSKSCKLFCYTCSTVPYVVQRLAHSSLQKPVRNARKIIHKFKGKHYHESNSLLYLPPERGGRCFQEITQLYKTTKNKNSPPHYN